MHNKTAGYRTYAEPAVSLIAVITAIKLTRIIPPMPEIWILTPAILIAAALIPSIIRKQNPVQTILLLSNIKRSLKLLAYTCIIVFPLLFISLLLLKHFPIIEPALPIPPGKGQFTNWVIFQFLYIAVSEEIFFRAYLQTKILKALNPQLTATADETKKQWIAIIISSSAFTAAHMIIFADPAAILVFLPAMIFGRLFASTKSLIAPILFHGMSNTAFYLMVQYLDIL